ncbi:MAG: ABC transporter substrate-binding protein [Deltaproteobacteria bacterium]|nr:ABC transporter substrate-binding protein [Deltaproteobacteria bacterium]
MKGFSIIGTVLLITVCHSLSGAAVSPLEKINVSYGSISGTQAPVWVAKEKGLFEKYGLDPSLVYIPGGPRSVMAMLGGSVQYVIHSAMPSLEAYLGGADTALIGSSMNRLDHYLVVHPNITGTQDLRGKVIGISALGALTDAALREALRLNGMSERDVTVLAVGDLGARISGLRTGTIHGTMLIGAQAAAAARMGFKLLIDFSSLAIEISTASVLSRRAYVVKNPETTLKFLKTWIEGTYFFKSNREASLAVLKKYTRTDDLEILDSIYGRYRKLILSRPLPSVSTARSMLKILSRTRTGVREGNPDGFIEPRFVLELEKSGFFEELGKQYPAAKE